MSRRKYIYRPDGNGGVDIIEVSSDWTDMPRSTGDLGKFEYDNLQATDGTDISSRTKHKRYMAERNLGLASDYTETLKKAEKERANIFSNPKTKESRRESLARAFYQLSKGKKR